MHRYWQALALILLVAIAFAGCSDDAIVSGDETPDPSGVISGEIGPQTDFEMVIDAAIGPDRLFRGPFRLRGSNLHYDDALGALVVDLSIINASRSSFPMPVSLTFINLLPPGVTVLNPDNGINGPGAMIEFDFANDDLLWTPGEQSLPREVQFKVDPGVSIGFVARLDVGMHPEGGSIGGIVWHDRNKNGMMDTDEPGLGGVRIWLTEGPFDSLMLRPVSFFETRTAPDGTYRFDGLWVGKYVVAKPPLGDYVLTTPGEIHVLLTADSSGTVGDFLHGDFGCVPRKPDGPIEVGDFVAVSGEYVAEPHRVIAREIKRQRCELPDSVDTPGNGGHGGCDPGTIDCPCFFGPGILRGPVTRIDANTNIIEVMGTSIRQAFIDAASVNLEVRVGDRVDIRVVRTATGELIGLMLRKWEGLGEQVHGIVDEVIVESGNLRGLKILNTTIVIPNITPGDD